MWNVTVHNPDSSGYTVNLTWDISSIPGSEYSSVQLVDVDGGTTIDMQTESNYLFFIDPGEMHEFKIVCNITGPAELEFGDAPEGPGAVAYPSTGTLGAFPTCKTVGPSGWIEHNNFGAWFGPMVDFELDGNGGFCPGCFPLYDQDECFIDGDAGLLIPDPYTIDPGLNLNVIPCPSGAGTLLGLVGNPAVWGVDIDIDVTNFMPSATTGYVNVLMDWNQNGIWGDPGEHVLVNFPVPNGHTGPLSILGPPGFIIGPNPGYVWSRFSITEVPVSATPEWNGEGVFEDGETEDYLLKISQIFTLSITYSGTGSGSVNAVPGGPYYYGDVVSLTANAAVGSHFVAWSGDLTGSTSPDTITMDGNKNVDAQFTFDTTITVNISLEAGWNLITVPVENVMMASDLAENITGSIMISRFDSVNQTYKTYIVGGPPGFDFPVVDGYGYFVLVDQNSTLSMSGYRIDSVSVPLSIGWNMIGWYHSSDTTASSLSENVTGCIMVSWFDPISQSFKTYIVGGPPGFDFTITPGMGLFVLVDESSVWHGEG